MPVGVRSPAAFPDSHPSRDHGEDYRRTSTTRADSQSLWFF